MIGYLKVWAEFLALFALWLVACMAVVALLEALA